MTLDKALSCNSVRASLLVWDYPEKATGHWYEDDIIADSLEKGLHMVKAGILEYERWDAEVVKLFLRMEQHEHDPTFWMGIEDNLKKHDLWWEFRKKTHVWPDELRVIAEGLETIVPDEPFEYPQFCKDIYWLMQHTVMSVINRYDARPKEGTIELSMVSLGIGRTIMMLANCTAAKILRRDQAKKFLELALEPQYICVRFHDLIFRSEFLELVDEAEIDDDVTKTIDDIIAANGKAVAEWLGGKEKALGSMIGQVMKVVKTDPRAVRELIISRIKK